MFLHTFFSSGIKQHQPRPRFLGSETRSSCLRCTMVHIGECVQSEADSCESHIRAGTNTFSRSGHKTMSYTRSTFRIHLVSRFFPSSCHLNSPTRRDRKQGYRLPSLLHSNIWSRDEKNRSGTSQVFGEMAANGTVTERSTCSRLRISCCCCCVPVRSGPKRSDRRAVGTIVSPKFDDVISRFRQKIVSVLVMSKI